MPGAAFGTCPKCGEAYSVGAAFCSRCGQQLGHFPGSAPVNAAGGAGGSGVAPNWPIRPASPQHMAIGNNQPQMRGDWGRTPAQSWLGRYWWALVLACVLVFIAIPAAIAFPTFQGQQQRARDSAAKSLVRDAMVTVESGYVDSLDLTTLTPANLEAIDPNISWPADFTANAGSSPAGVDASRNQVSVSIDDANKYEIGTISKSGTEFGVVVDKSAHSTTYYRGGRAVASWEYGSSRD